MKKLFFLFFSIHTTLLAQNLTVSKATVQTIKNSTVTHSSINYIILVKKTNAFYWSIDSVYSTADNKKVNYHILKIDDPTVSSPRYEKLDTFEKKHKGFIQLTFSKATIIPTGGRPNPPGFEKENANDYSNGVKIYYSVKKYKFKWWYIERNKKSNVLEVKSFEELETITMP